ncbi:MAG: damage-inducible mutagenesis protein [Alphaproteobacteria bacterium]|nr:damage-inducible mutagenesis protein [Alphaproteobacteria bacterium]
MLRTTPSSSPSSAASGRAAPQVSARLAELRRRIDALERAGPGHMAGQRAAPALRALPFGAPEIDDALPWRGLAAGALHEVSGPARDAAALGFVSALLARLAARAPGAVLWCRRRGASYESGDIYAPGLAAFGLDPSRLILLGAKQRRDVLWAMREGLSCPRLLAVVGEVETAAVGLTVSRRLQLAAEKSGAGCFLLRTVPPEGGRLNNALPEGAASEITPGNVEEPSAALSRWRLRAAPSGPVPGLAAAAAERWFGPGRLRWHAELRRCRAAASRQWLVEWHHETGNFTVAAPLCDRPVEQAAAGLAI